MHNGFCGTKPNAYDVRMDFAVDELQPPMLAGPQNGGLGVEAPADADLRGYLARLNGVLVASSEDEPDIASVSANGGNGRQTKSAPSR